jgi:hypothetical protein
MRLLWIFLAAFSAVAILTLSTMSIEMAIGIKWSLIVLFLFSIVRLIYYNTKFFFVRIIWIFTMMMVLYHWRSELNLRHNWIPRQVMYKNRHLDNRTIELQTQETGEWPKRRIVDRFSLLPFIYWKRELDEVAVLELDTLSWQEVNHKVIRSKARTQQ